MGSRLQTPPPQRDRHAGSELPDALADQSVAQAEAEPELSGTPTVVLCAVTAPVYIGRSRPILRATTASMKTAPPKVRNSVSFLNMAPLHELPLDTFDDHQVTKGFPSCPAALACGLRCPQVRRAPELEVHVAQGFEAELEKFIEVAPVFPGDRARSHVLLRGIPRVGDAFSWAPPPRRRPRAGQFVVERVEWMWQGRSPVEVVVRLGPAPAIPAT